MNDHELQPLRKVIRTYGIHARKNLGQNFIQDLDLTGKIARSTGSLEGVTVIEVGAGPGGLTRSLLQEGAKHVIAIECDLRAIGALEDIAKCYPSRLSIIAGDAMKQDFAQLAQGVVRVISNPPYNIATILLTHWMTCLDWPPFFDQVVLMLQHEVAERIAASVGSKAYGRLSVLAQWRCEPRILFNVPRTSFIPSPKVDSSLIALIPRDAPYPCQLHTLQQVTAITFGQRRKMLRTSLKRLIPNVSEQLDALGIDPLARPETLSVADFCALARMFESLGILAAR